MIELWRNVWINSIEKILKLLSWINISDICQDFHFFLEFIFQKPIVNPDNSLNINSTNNILHQILRMETGFNQINTTYKPLLTHFTLLQSNIPSGLKLGQKLSYWYFINIS